MRKLSVVIGASVLVAMGAVGVAIAQEHMQPARVASSGTMSMGATSTQETPATTPATPVASPAVKAGS